MIDNQNSQDRTSLLAHVANMYYIEGKDQTAIAGEVGVTRSMISRMLTDARKRGIVEIRINHPLISDHTLEVQIKHRFGIETVFVVSIRRDDDHDRLLSDLGRAGASVLQRYLEPGKVVGMAWGTTVSATVDSVDNHQNIPLKIIQLLGALGARNHEYDGHALVQRLADKLGGECYFLNAPYLCQTPEIAQALMNTPGIRETVKLGGQVNIALLGIGTTELQFSSYYLAGYVESHEITRLRNAGVVGDIAGNHFTIDGEMHVDEFTQRQITIQDKVLRNIPTRLCVAGGPGKVQSIIGAMRSGLVNVLVTDSITARNILTAVE